MDVRQEALVRYTATANRSAVAEDWRVAVEEAVALLPLLLPLQSPPPRLLLSSSSWKVLLRS